MFDYFISLGLKCPMAYSMSKYGLRSFSGPFDWLITPDFDWVLHYIETDFEDFLLQENLERYDEYANHFQDKQSGVKFMHDYDNFETEYDRLKEKYDKLISRFCEKTQGRICYLRSVLSGKEIKYIEDNAGYIKRVIKRRNCDSEIVFLFDKNLSIPDEFGFRCYKMPGIWSVSSVCAMRSYFDYADDFLEFCRKNYSDRERLENLEFDQKKMHNYTKLTEHKYLTLSALLSHDFTADTLPDKIIIYGATVIGKELYRKVKKLTTVLYFIDRNKAENEFESIKIISANDIKHMDGVKVIVSVTYAFDEIKKNLLGKFQDTDIISLDDILHLDYPDF